MTLHPESLRAAGLAFEKRRGVTLGQDELMTVENAGFDTADLDSLADAIWEYVEHEKEEGFRLSAYWALGKQYRKSDLKRFAAALRRELPRSSRCVFQILIALENCGEKAFDRKRSGRSIDEEEVNRADAMAYLGHTPHP